MSKDPKIESAVLGGMLTDSSFACAQVVERFGAPALKQWREINANDIATALEETISDVRDGDLAAMEAMLVSQAVALQTIFTTLAMRAESQTSRENISLVLGLALKAQSQSRATIQALVDLKFPRSTSFVKQTNIAHGAQQVNNGVAPPPLGAHEDASILPNKQIALEVINGGTILDAGAALAAGGSNSTLEPVESIDRTAKPARKGRRVQ